MTHVPPETTRERVLRVADILFATHGYAAVSMRQVAGAAGVTKPALYYHFRDKEALFEECVLASQLRLGELIRHAAAEDRPLRERVAAVAEVLLSGSPHHPVRTQADVAEHLPGQARQRVLRSYDEHLLTPITRLFDAARGDLRDSVDSADAALALLGVSLAHLPPQPSRAGAVDGAHAPSPNAAAAHRPGVVAERIADLLLQGVGR